MTASRSPYRDLLAPYSQPSNARGWTTIATSLLPWLAVSVAMYLLLSVSPLLTIALVPLSAGFLIRTFVVFHDLGHGSLLPNRTVNDLVGRILGVIVLTPFSAWRYEHAVHHATAGDLDRRGVGDVETMTVAEYNQSSPGKRWAYRTFRNPWVMFGIGPVVAMMIVPRIAKRTMKPKVRNSVLINDAILVALFALGVWALGWWQLLVVWLPAAILAGAAGIFLFYVQHQFEDAYWQRREDWNYFDSALQGSSFLALPRILHFFSGNIGFHHLHHLNPRIPCYNLPAAHGASPRFAEVPTLTIRDGMRCVRLKLWDERSGRMVTFAEAARESAPVPAAEPAGVPEPSGA